MGRPTAGGAGAALLGLAHAFGRGRRALARLFTAGPSVLSQWQRFLLVGCLLSAAGLVPVVAALSHRSGTLQLASLTCTLGLCWWWARGYRRRGFPLWSTPLEAAALVVVSGGVAHPAHALSIFYTGLYLRSLYGSLPEALGRAVLYLAAYFAAVALLADPASNPVPAFISVSQIPAFIFSAWLLNTLGRTLAQHEQAAARDRIISQASARLVAAAGPEQIWAEVRRAGLALVEGGAVAGFAAVDGRHLAALDETGRPLTDGAARVRLSSIRAAIRRELAAGRPVRLREPLPEVRRIFGLPPEFRHLILVPVTVRGGLAGLAAVAARGPVPDGRVGALAFLTREAGLALERAALAEEVRSSEARFRSLVQNAVDVILVTDAAGTVQYASPGVEQALGRPPAEVCGRPCWEWLHPDDAPELRALLAAPGPGTLRPVHLRGRHRDGSWRWLETRVTNLLADPAVRGMVINQHDVTDRKALEAELLHQAQRDPLTGLANRSLFRERVEQALERSHGHGGQVAVLFIDLDEFKTVNDSLGHIAGDRALVEVGQRLLRHLGRDSADTVARLGGDEFAVLLEELYNVHQARRTALGILEALHQPLHLDGRELIIGASVGIAVGRGDGVDADELLRNADVAMYAAKRQGKGRYALFEPIMHSRLVERLDLVGSLRRALERGELVLHYQPVVWLQPVRIIGVEALLRWEHPERGTIPPGEFVPLAEETDLIRPIGRWALHEACRQVRAWQEAFPMDPPLAVGVNVSARQIHQPGLINDVADALQRSGLPADRLVLEITETAAMQDPAVTVKRLRQLKEQGVRLAVDDFGAGYSSLSHLRRFPIDFLKIDKSFVAGVGSEPEEAALMGAIIRLGHTLGLRTVAEGIETAAQLARLQMLGCDTGQGFLFSRPLAAPDLEALLARATAGGGWWQAGQEASSA